MAQVPALNPPAAASPGFVPSGALPVVAHISMFAGFGWCLAQVSLFQVIFDDLGEKLTGRTAAVMAVNDLFKSVHLPLWSLAVVGLAVDLGVCWVLRRKGRFQAAHNWMWLVTAGVMPASVLVLSSAIAPFSAPLVNRCFR